MKKKKPRENLEMLAESCIEEGVELELDWDKGMRTRAPAT